MELYLRAQFEMLLQDATGNFAERIVHRCGGPDQAWARLSADPDGVGVFRSDFVASFFAENLLDNPAGYAFVLEALAQRTVPSDPGGEVTQVLARLASAAFGDVLTSMVGQLLQRQQIYS